MMAHVVVIDDVHHDVLSPVLGVDIPADIERTVPDADARPVGQPDDASAVQRYHSSLISPTVRYILGISDSVSSYTASR